MTSTRPRPLPRPYTRDFVRNRATRTHRLNRFLKPLSWQASSEATKIGYHFTGCAFIICGIAFISIDTPTVHAQGDIEDERLEAAYVGADECSSCHRNVTRDHASTNHALALQDVGRRKNNILGDFDLGEDVRSVLLPDERTAPVH